MNSLRLLVPLLSLLGLAGLILRRLVDFGAFTTSENFNTESCQVIANFSTCEDLQIDYTNDLLYLSASNWTAQLKGDWSSSREGIYTIDLKQKDAKPKLVSIDQPAAFHPHGIHLYTDSQTGEKVLYVVNHPQRGQSTIGIFDVVDRDTLKHRETIVYEPLIHANEVFGTGKRSFYVTQDSVYETCSNMMTLASALGKENGSLFHYDGKNWKTIDEGLNFGNGVAASPDDKSLYVAETSTEKVRVYEGDVKSGDVHYKRMHNIGLFPDNIHMDSEGNLWAAGFASAFKITERMKGRDINSPVRIMKARFAGGKLTDLRKMLTSMGDDIYGITAVIPYKDKMIMSGVLPMEVRMCDMPKDAPRADISVDTEL